MKLIREINDKLKLTSPSKCLKYLEEFRNEDREYFIVLGLDSNNSVLYREIVSIGILNCCLIHPREVFKKAIMSSANSIIIAHNHPSGNCEPSQEDRKIYETLKKGADLLDIPIIDHIIIAPVGYYSFSENEFI